MNILVINGSPKGKRSNTYRLTTAFLEGIAEKAETEIEEITVREKNIGTCLGCFGCWNQTPGACVVKDDMKMVLEKLLWADVIIWSFGLYYFNVPGKLKLLIDRQLPLALPFMVSESESGGHPSRYDMSEKRHVIISTCGFYTAQGNYESVCSMFDHFLGKEQYETIFCGQGELFRVEELHERTDAYLQTVRKAGTEFATSGITHQTKEELSRLLFPRETFEAMADASWGVSKETGEKEDDSYAFTKQMASLYNKASYDGKDKILEMDYTDKGFSYQIVLKQDGYEVRKDQFLTPTTIIHTPYTVWKDIAAGKISGVEAMMQKLYSVEGDFDLMIHWDRYFGTGSPAPTDEKTSRKKAGGTNMILTLLPWITFWVAASIHTTVGGFVAIGVCALMGLLFFRFRKTIYDELSVTAVIGFSVLVLLLPDAVNLILPGSYLAFGLMWSLSCLTQVPLTAWYSMNQYEGEAALQNPLFMRTNRILTLAWGILYLVTAVWTFFLMRTPVSPYLAIINNIMPILMGIFTAWFQRWYPAHYASGR